MKNILNFNKPKVLNMNMDKRIFVVSSRDGIRIKHFAFLIPTYNTKKEVDKNKKWKLQNATLPDTSVGLFTKTLYNKKGFFLIGKKTIKSILFINRLKIRNVV